LRICHVGIFGDGFKKDIVAAHKYEDGLFWTKVKKTLSNFKNSSVPTMRAVSSFEFHQ
jgi:hypothetical protein